MLNDVLMYREVPKENDSQDDIVSFSFEWLNTPEEEEAELRLYFRDKEELEKFLHTHKKYLNSLNIESVREKVRCRINMLEEALKQWRDDE